jgi:F0F1-type ATP synthase membrane subunit b/b'
MSIDSGFSIVISFIGFVYVFIKKVRPSAVKTLDDRIDFVKKTFSDAEQLRDRNGLQLDNAVRLKSEIALQINQSQQASRGRIEKYSRDSAAALAASAARLEASTKAQLEAEEIKHQEILLDRISSEIVSRIAAMAKEGTCDTSLKLSAKDLEKLL